MNFTGFRTITIVGESSNLHYSQGNTKVCVKKQDVLKYAQLHYDVASLADRINYQTYRYGRRHSEIQNFLNVAFDLVKPPFSIVLRVLSTDGTSRCTAVNSMLKLFKTAEFNKVPLATSFGKYNDQLVYDLSYIEDSQGAGDCAVMFYVDLLNCTTIITNILYEGVMTFDQFMTGLINSQINCIQLGSQL